MRTGCTLLLIVAFHACSGPTRAPDGEAVEVDVISAYINEFYSHDLYKLLVISSTTEIRYVLSTQGMKRLAEKGKVEWTESMGPIDALLYTGFQRGPLNGGGALMLFRKSDGKWNVVDKMNIWVS